MANKTFFFSNQDFAVYLTTYGEVIGLRTITAAQPNIRISLSRPRNEADRVEANRARELGLPVEIPIPVPEWSGKTLGREQFSQIVESVWENREFSTQVVAWVVNPRESLLEELQEAGGFVLTDKYGTIEISAWVELTSAEREKHPGYCARMVARIGAYSSDGPWPPLEDANGVLQGQVPKQIRDLLGDLAKVAERSSSQAKKAREEEEKLRLKAKFGL